MSLTPAELRHLSLNQLVPGLLPGFPLFPPRGPLPSLELDMVRPDDLLNLHVAAYNLVSDRHPSTPALVRVSEGTDAFLVFTFPPQTIAEHAIFETATLLPEPRPGQSVDPPAATEQPPTIDPPPVAARLADSTRLVFRVPATVQVLFSVEGLLDWSKLELVVSPIADFPLEPDPATLATAPAIAPPDELQTAIELPYRLIISPNHAVAWQHSLSAVTHRGRTELWHTRLALPSPGGPVELSREHTAPVRAVWSPDSTNPPPVPDVPDPDLGRAAMTPNDRYQIVELTADFAGFRDAGVPPVMPTPVQAERLFLSSLGGWLRSRGEWNLDQIILRGPPRLAAAARRRRRHPAPDTLDLTEWVHDASQGRDHYVRLVYEGHVYPFGHRCSLVKVTERRFEELHGVPFAYLVQYVYVVIREPVKEYAATLYTHNGREMPVKRIRFTTLVTPHLLEPGKPPVKIAGTDRSFWIMDEQTGQDFPFHAVAEDVAGSSFEFSASLIFVKRNESQVAKVIEAYAAGSSDPQPRRACVVAGQKVSFAPANADPATDNTRLTTQALHFTTQNGPAAFGGFVPTLFKADVRLPAVEQLLGTSQTTTIAFFDRYLNSDFDAHAGVFARFVTDSGGALADDSLPVTFSADKAGGISTPNMKLTALTREHGPLAGKPVDAAADRFDATEFFGGFSGSNVPKLFGSLNLTDLFAPPGDPSATASVNAPKVQFKTTDLSATVKQLATTFDWSPAIRPLDIPSPSAPVLSFKPLAGSKLEIHGKIEKPVAVPGSPLPAGVDPAGTFEFRGELSNFTLEFFNVVDLNFASFQFTATKGKSADVNIHLVDPTPISFTGDLKFIQDLSEVIPPGLLGDGPQLDISPTDVHLGYSIGLPPLSVGVFSLTNLTFSVGLDLPFLSGKPLLDVAFASRHNPCVLAVELLGGGGFVHIELDAEAIRLLEVAFEFGAMADLNLGVASGSVHIMAGIYFSMQTRDGRTQTVLAGFLDAGGEVSVLGLISISVDFNITFTYDFGQDKATGRATLTVSVHVAFFSKSVELTVERSFGGHGGDPSFGDMFHTPAVWHDYAAAFA